MTKEIISVICLLLVFLGLVALAYYVILRILRPKKSGKYVVLVSADDTSADVADRLCSEYMRLELLGELPNGRVVVIDRGMTGEERRRCEEFCRETRNVFVCDPGALDQLAERLLN